MINGVTELIMMKADVLSGFEKIKVCTQYEVKGEAQDNFPFDISPEYVKPIYKELKGWKQDLTGVKSANDMPSELVEYILFLEKQLHVPITIVSVGPDRTQTLFR